MFRKTDEKTMVARLAAVGETLKEAFDLPASAQERTQEQIRFDQHLAEVSNDGAARISQFPRLTYGV